MNKKILIGIGIAAVIIALLVGIYFIYVYKPTVPAKEQLIEKYSEFKTQCNEKKAQGYDVTEAEDFARKAKQAFDKKDYAGANKFLDNAFEALEKAEKIPVIPEEVKEEAKKKLSQVKVASLYQKVTDGKVIGRTVDDVIKIFNETKTDFIYRGFWRQSPLKDSAYSELEQAISQIKEEMPGVIFCGGHTSLTLPATERNPITGDILDRDKTWSMALDPGKWGIPVSKEEFQKQYAIKHRWLSPGDEYDWQKMPAYFPDITNPDFQELLLSWSKKQIDCGADAIWFDGLYGHAVALGEITGNPDHPAVKESFDATSKMVDELRNYGSSKGRYIYVGTRSKYFVELPYLPADLDFVAESFGSKEIIEKEPDDEKWKEKQSQVREKLGDAVIFTYMDWGAQDNTPLATFSQKLTPEEQREFLNIADEFSENNGMKFVYPLHGGFMGKNAKILAMGKFPIYDSLAPEFETYKRIKELARKYKLR